jgi:very-short-patch-repair endonuclease
MPADRGVPRHDAGPLDWLTFEQSGVVTSRQAVDALGRGAVRGRLRSGAWRSICRGVVSTTNGRLDHDQQIWVAVLAAGRGAVLGGATALGEAGVRGLRSGSLQIVVPAARRASSALPRLPPDMPAVRVRRTTILPDEHLQIGRPPRTTVARSVVDAAAWARSDDEARTVLAATCQQRLVLPAAIEQVLTLLPRIRRRGLIRTTVADIAGGAQALSEIDLLALCRRYRLPLPDLQERRRDAAGRHRFLDAYWREWHVHAEVDGAHHMDVRHWADDMRRQNEIWIAGDVILRFPAWVIRARPAEVAEQLRRALLAGGWK